MKSRSARNLALVLLVIVLSIVVISAALSASNDDESPTAEAIATAAATEDSTEITAEAEITPEATAEATAEITAEATEAVEMALDQALYEQGIAVYRKNFCGTCHTLAAAGTRGTFGPVQDHIGTTAQERIADPAYAGTATTAADYLHESIVEPQAFIVPEFMASSHAMPGFAHLDEADIDALVYMLLQQE